MAQNIKASNEGNNQNRICCSDHYRRIATIGNRYRIYFRRGDRNSYEVGLKIMWIKQVPFSIKACSDNKCWQLFTGVLMSEIVNASNATVHGKIVQPKMRLYAAHETNVAVLMAAVRVFDPHQPPYGAIFFGSIGALGSMERR